MTTLDVCGAIAQRLGALWPQRFLYRDFCPEGHERPSGFLYVSQSGYTDVNISMVQWTMEARLELFCATDAYEISSTEELRKDQEAVLLAFGQPSIQVGDRWLPLTVQGDGMEMGSAFVVFRCSWTDKRPEYHDPADPNDPVTAAIPKMEDFALRTVERKEG